jgi:hypothetical protein
MDDVIGRIQIEPDLVASAESALKAVREHLPTLSLGNLPLTMLLSKRFLPLFITQFIGAFCDNVFKNAFVLLTTFGLARAHGWNPNTAVYLIGGLFILPFVLVSGWAGYVSDIWPRHTLVRALKTFEVFVMLAAALALYFDSFYGMWAIIVALGFISAMFGPLKYGLLPVYLRTEELVSGNAWFEAGSFIAIVAGTLVGARAAAGDTGRNEVEILLVALGVIGCISTYFLPPAPASAVPTYLTLEPPLPPPLARWTPWGRSGGTPSSGGASSASPGSGAWAPCSSPSCRPTSDRPPPGRQRGDPLPPLLRHRRRGRLLPRDLPEPWPSSATYVPLAGLAMSAFIFLWVFADRFATPAPRDLPDDHHFRDRDRRRHLLRAALRPHAAPQPGRPARAGHLGQQHHERDLHGGGRHRRDRGRDDRPAARGTLLAVLGLATWWPRLYMVWLLPESVLQTVVRLVLRLCFRVRVKGIENFPASGPRLVIANHTSWLDAALLAAFLPEPPSSPSTPRSRGSAG